MKNILRLPYLLIMVCLLLIVPGTSGATAGEFPRFTLELEAGPVWQTVNDVQVPNNSTGTRFSLVDLAGEGPQFAWRGYFTWRIAEKHSLRGLYAPLSFTEPGTPNIPIEFNGSSFAADEEVLATYKFNSYRLTYRYRWHQGEKWRWWVGFTAKIRDAKIQLVQGTVSSTKTDVGFVPLLQFAGSWQMGKRWNLNLDLDGLAGGPGRAVDASLKVGFDFSPGWHLQAGYRTVEGGADVDEVYSFAWLHYAVISLALDF